MKLTDLSNRRLGVIVGAASLVPILYFAARPVLPELWRQSGTAAMYLTAVAGVVLLLMSIGYVMAKRRHVYSPRRLMTAHVTTASFGMALVIVHSTGSVDRIPFIIVGILLALAALGIWARTRLANKMSSTFARKPGGFQPVDPAVTAQLRTVIQKKTDVLERLDPDAQEATFSVTLQHLLRQPRLAWVYWRLARQEDALTGARQSVGAGQAWWRPAHILLAVAFVGGLAVHILTVTFFAGYVAGEREIYWWHLTAW